MPGTGSVMNSRGSSKGSRGPGAGAHQLANHSQRFIYTYLKKLGVDFRNVAWKCGKTLIATLMLVTWEMCGERTVVRLDYFGYPLVTGVSPFTSVLVTL